MTPGEREAQEALRQAVAAIAAAVALCERADYGSEVLGPLFDAAGLVQHVLLLVEGKR